MCRKTERHSLWLLSALWFRDEGPEQATPTHQWLWGCLNKLIRCIRHLIIQKSYNPVRFSKDRLYNHTHNIQSYKWLLCSFPWMTENAKYSLIRNLSGSDRCRITGTLGNKDIPLIVRYFILIFCSVLWVKTNHISPVGRSPSFPGQYVGRIPIV